MIIGHYLHPHVEEIKKIVKRAMQTSHRSGENRKQHANASFEGNELWLIIRKE